jgi:hypothetical protein
MSFRLEQVNESVTLLNSMQGIRYFGHWLRDDCAAYEAVRDASRLMSLSLPAWANFPFYVNAFDQEWDVLDDFWTPELRLVRELGFSSDKRRRIELLRKS